jgi:hypothetical protein
LHRPGHELLFGDRQMASRGFPLRRTQSSDVWLEASIPLPVNPETVSRLIADDLDVDQTKWSAGRHRVCAMDGRQKAKGPDDAGP